MISVSQAKEQILKALPRLKTETIKIENSLDRILAEPVTADRDFPLFDNSAMDGIALQAADTEGASPEHPVNLSLIETIPAGYAADKALNAGQAAQIMTGAPVPPGADAVLPVESTDLDFSKPLDRTEVSIFRQINPGDYIRRQGEYYRHGEVLLDKGWVIRTQDIALFATVGQAEIPVYRKPKVGLLTTGDELVAPDEPLEPGKIRDSNSYMLRALLENAGAVAITSGVVADKEEEVVQALDQLVEQGIDLLLTSGGVSMGAFDVVRKVLETYGQVELWKVNMRPGKPLTFGRYRQIPFIGLAGNPVSAFVGFQVFVLPALRHMAGIAAPLKTIEARLTSVLRSDGRESYIPASLKNEQDAWFVEPVQNQSSGNLYALIPTNSLIILPVGVEFLNKGEPVKVFEM